MEAWLNAAAIVCSVGVEAHSAWLGTKSIAGTSETNKAFIWFVSRASLNEQPTKPQNWFQFLQQQRFNSD